MRSKYRRLIGSALPIVWGVTVAALKLVCNVDVPQSVFYCVLVGCVALGVIYGM